MATAAAGQVVRFETTMGDFDMVLNPTNNPKLQAHVDNMLDYVNREAYKGSWINRAQSDFVLQMGGFYSMTKRPGLTIDSVRHIRSFFPVPGEPAVENPGLSNTAGTVSLALSSLSNGQTNQDSGTTSFFVNIGDNSSLDSDFTVFAAIPDMSVVNAIMALNKIDRTQDPVFGASAGNLAFQDVPVQADGYQVLIKRAFVISDAMTITKDTTDVQSIVAQSADAFASSPSMLLSNTTSATSAGSDAPLSQNVVPEPASVFLAAVGFLSLGLFSRRPSR